MSSIIDYAERQVSNMASRAAGFASAASSAAVAGNNWVNSLVLPGANSVPVVPGAPAPLYTAPAFQEKQLVLAPVTTSTKLDPPANLKGCAKLDCNPKLGDPDEKIQELSNVSVPDYDWEAPIFPGLALVPSIEPINAVSAPTPVFYPDISGVKPRDPGAEPKWSGTKPTVITNKPSFSWTKPTRPTASSIGTAKDTPAITKPTAIYTPDVSGIDLPSNTTPPDWDSDVTFDISGAPNTKPILEVIPVPTVTIPDVPQEPDWVYPTAITLSDVVLPSLRPINVPNFSSVEVPSLVAPNLADRLDFTEEEFDQSLLQELISEVKEVLGGRLAVPSHIWTQIWQRVAVDINRQYLARKREARRAHAKLGWSMPGGVLLDALQTAATDIHAEISAKANEIAIKQAEMQQSDYWQAMQQGVACTNLLYQIHNSRQERLLKAAIATLETQVSIFNAVVAAYNARVQAVNIDLEAKKASLQAELSKLEVYKTEMQGAQLGVELDKARVEMYVAQWQGVKTQAEAYEALIRGVTLKVEAQKAAVEAYGEQIKAQSAIVQMWATEWEAYAKKLEAEKLKLGKFETEARVFEAQIGRYKAMIEGQSQRSNVQIEAKKLLLQRAQIDSERYKSDWQGEQIRLAAYDAYLKARDQLINEANQRIELYKADIQQESSRSQAWQGEYDAYAKLADGEKIKLNLYETESRVYGTLVEAYKAKTQALNAYTASEIEVKKLGLQRSQIDIERYKADWGGEQTKIAYYDAYLKGIGFPLEAAKVNASIYQSAVQGEVGRSQAWLNRYDAYVKLLQPDAIRAQLQSSYAALFNAYVAKANISVEVAKVEADLNKAYQSLLQEYNKAKVGEMQADATFKAAQVSAQAQMWNVSAELYKADVEGQKAMAATQAEIYRTSVDAAKASSELLLQGSIAIGDQWKAAAQVTAAQYQATASVYAQIGAAAFAATNASISASSSQSSNKSWAHGLTGSMSGDIGEMSPQGDWSVIGPGTPDF